MLEMAYAALSSLANTTDQILNRDQYPFSLPAKEIKSIYDHSIFLQAFLDDFLEKAKSMEERIMDVANEAEDTIESIISEKIRSHGGLIESAEKLSRTKIRRQVTKVAKKIDSVAAEVMGIKNSFIIKDVGAASDFSANSRSSSRLAPTSKDAMVGFEKELLLIKDRLCGESPARQVLPIVGMGGIGKTTLARNVYDDPLIVEHFDIRAWVTVSQDYNAQEILQGILVSLKEFNVTSETDDEESAETTEIKIELSVYQTLKSRRYLIVMDDMWSTKAWDDLRHVFPDDLNGSRIMLTTRLSEVAAYPDSSVPLHEMRFMNPNESWNLLRKEVFAEGDCPPELETIGKNILRSCEGLPIAIVVIAGLLSTMPMNRALWQEIAHNVSSALATNDGQLQKILSLSYTHLPSHLRLCFLYMGCFPEDYKIDAPRLIKLWVAEGFLKPPNGSKSFEESAEEYLEELVKRNLVLVAERKSNGTIKSCSLHDLMRDLCIKKAQQDKFLLHVRYNLAGKSGSVRKHRRVSFVHFSLDRILHTCGSTVRTIITFQCSEGSSLFNLRKFKLLRVLDMVHNSSIRLPEQVFELFHLRYLSFVSWNMISAAISNLQNLQTLIIRSTSFYLPVEIWRMSQLRHLVSYSFEYLPIPEGATFSLENLQTLSAVSNLRCTQKVLKMIPNLKKLAIIYSGLNCDGDYELNNLVLLHQLENLKLSIEACPSLQRHLNAAFPRTLRKLTLSGWRLSWKDTVIFGWLPDLRVLKLKGVVFQGGLWETTEGQFSQLHFLLIDGSDLEHWITDSSHFPKLKCLVLHRCRRLSEIPYEIGEIPTLELIEVDDWDSYLVQSAKQIQEEQQSYGNDALQVRCVHN